MSATVNQDAAQSVSKQPGEFGSSRPPQPQQAKGHHQPGKIVPGSKDEIPESHVETMPAGTAPKDRTFEPQTGGDIPGQALNPEASNPETEGQGSTSASDTLVGSSSADVHTGLGHPGAGMSSAEKHHDGGKKQGQGMQGVGASGAVSADQHDSTRKPIPEDKGKRQP